MFFCVLFPKLFFKRVIILPKFGEICSFVRACVVRASERPHVRARDQHYFCCFVASGRVSIFLNVGNEQANEQTNERTNKKAMEQMNKRPKKRQTKQTNERTNERTNKRTNEIAINYKRPNERATECRAKKQEKCG